MFRMKKAKEIEIVVEIVGVGPCYPFVSLKVKENSIVQGTIYSIADCNKNY